jgi:outer membrane protein OmpA-like peptidoglycan-associated protein
MGYLFNLKNTRNTLLAITLLLHFNMFAQTRSYSVALAPFSTSTSDEFSPVYYKNGIVFCSNLKNNSLVTYIDEQKKMFNVFFVAKKDSNNWADVNLLAKELTTNYNDGPGSFDETGNTFFYCRNNNIRQLLKDFSDTTNKLGIYSADLIHGEWTNIRPFPCNNPLYSLVTPALTADGKRLYFASDMPGGYGGADLYYCDWKDNHWDKPVNLGPAINTPKNESYPFACKSGKLFFASDGLQGFGGKDLYYSQEIDGSWIHPIHLDADINSPEDDFGLVTDENFRNGYFSSNRRKTDDIFSFTTDPVQFPASDSMVKNNYCFLFYDEFQNVNDTIPVKYEWDFGNGIKKYGLQVKYCFPGAGKYEVKLNLIDSLKSDSILSQTSYKFELNEINQVYINSPDFGIVNEAISFDGLKTKLPDFKISDYLWNFGDGYVIRGPVSKKVFVKKGVYTVQLGLLGDKDSIGNRSKTSVCKKIEIFDDYQELAMHKSKEIGEFDECVAMKRQKLSRNNYRNLVNTKRDHEAVEELNAFVVRIYLLDNLSELQKDKIVKNLYETSACTIAINDNVVDTTSWSVLAKIIGVLKDNHDLKLEIAVHTGDKGSSGKNLELSEKCALDLYSYFFNNGITDGTIHCKGYGESRPIIANKKEAENWNRRLEFIFSNNHN